MFVFSFALTGCGSQSRTRYYSQQKPSQIQNRAKINIPEYRLGFGDVIEVKFFRNTEFNDQIKVRPDGRISLMKVGDLYVAGMTPAQLDSVITEEYTKFVIDPDVTVIVREFGGYQVYVLGEVESPGGFQIQRNMTVLQAIALAGGIKKGGKLNSVMVIRRTASNKVGATKLDLKKVVQGNTLAGIYNNDIMVKQQDIIYIPKSSFTSVTEFMKDVYSGFLPPLDIYMRAVLYYDR